MIFEVKIISVQKLIQGLLGFADSFSFIVREVSLNNRKLASLVGHLSIHLIEKKKVKEWPGTILLMDYGELYKFTFNSETALILNNKEDNLFNWIHPDFPEDLVFYRDGRAVFVSTTHEKDAYFDLLPEEVSDLKVINEFKFK